MDDMARPLGIDLVGQSLAFHGPASRWQLASDAGPGISHRLARNYDQHTVDAYEFIRLCRTGPKGRQQAIEKYPLIARAEELNSNEALTAQLKISVLGGLDGPEIASRFSLESQLLDTWEKLFFDARGRRQHVGWVQAHIVIPAQRADGLELAARLKLVAAAGPVAARAVLDCDSRVPIEEGKRLFDRRLKLSLKFDAACSMPLDSDRDRLAFLRMHVEMIGREQSLRLQERKLEQRCRKALDQHELAKLRLEFAREREAKRAAARARREEERALVREGVRIAKEFQKEQLRAQWQVEQDAAVARAASSPLAALTWGGSEDARAEVPKPESCVTLGLDDCETFAVIRLAPRLEIDLAPAVVAVPA